MWEGEHLRFGTDAQTNLCAGTLPHLDGVAGYLAQRFERPDERIDYYWLPDGVDEYCNDGSLGCVPDERGAFSTFAIHRHELAHAIRWPERLARPLEEGLAEVYGDDWAPMAPLGTDIGALLQQGSGEGGVLPAIAYPLAGHFVSYVRAVHGQDGLMALDRASGHADSLSRTEDVYREVLGVELQDDITRYEANYPRCDQRSFRDNAFECDRNVVSAPRVTEEALDLGISLSCDDPSVLGPRLGERWTTVTLDVEEPGLYHVFAGRADGGARRSIRFRACDVSCFEAGEIPAFESPLFSGRMCLEARRYSFRFVMDSDDSGDYRLIVTHTGELCA